MLYWIIGVFVCVHTMHERLYMGMHKIYLLPQGKSQRELLLVYVQLLSKIFIDSDFCHNYLHTLYLFDSL